MTDLESDHGRHKPDQNPMVGFDFLKTRLERLGMLPGFQLCRWGLLRYVALIRNLLSAHINFLLLARGTFD